MKITATMHGEKKVIGEIRGDTYSTIRKPNHFMVKFHGFGISKGVLEKLKSGGVKRIVIEYLGVKKSRIYEFKLQQYLDTDLIHSYNGDIQHFVNIKELKGGTEQMATLKEEAKTYTGGTTKNIADLPSVSTSLDVKDITGVNSDNEEFSYKIIEMGTEAYRVPKTVLKQLKVILEDNPDLKSFKVRKTGSGLATEYQVIPLS